MLHSQFFNQPLACWPDSDSVVGSEYPLSPEQALVKNQQGYGIGFYPNTLEGGRSNDSVKAIRAWYIDIDYESAKPAWEDFLQISPLIPSFIVETKNGYHIYWLARNERPGELYVRQQEALIAFFGADEKCKNMARLLRVPGYLHQKDASEPFRIGIVFESEAIYTWKQMKIAFPLLEVEEQVSTEPTGSVDQNNMFDKIRFYDSKLILTALSGSSVVGGKKYRLKPKGKGHYNIIVDGKDSGCFVNASGNIIASAGHSGGAVEWLTWYGLSRIEAARAVCGVMGWDFKQ